MTMACMQAGHAGALADGFTIVVALLFRGLKLYASVAKRGHGLRAGGPRGRARGRARARRGRGRPGR